MKEFKIIKLNDDMRKVGSRWDDLAKEGARDLLHGIARKRTATNRMQLK